MCRTKTKNRNGKHTRRHICHCDRHQSPSRCSTVSSTKKKTNYSYVRKYRVELPSYIA